MTVQLPEAPAKTGRVAVEYDYMSGEMKRRVQYAVAQRDASGREVGRTTFWREEQ